jgi:hypothetical protein
MSTVPVVPSPSVPAVPPALSVPVIVFGETGQTFIPPGIKDLESFRRWAKSDDFPERGRFSYIAGTLWVDLSMEQLYTHNQVKGEVSAVLMPLVRSTDQGRYLPDGAFLSHPAVDLATVPDGIFASHEAFDSGRLREVPGARAGFVELEGTPDMVLEGVSDSSVVKDNEMLPRLYWRAGVREFWRVDARGAELRFEILLHGAVDFVPAESQEGWQRSQVFSKWFCFQQQTDRRGRPVFILEMRD